MVKTKQGSGRTGRKRGRRGGFRDPAFRTMVRNGEISPSAEIIPKAQRRTRGNAANTVTGSRDYLRKQYAETETLIMYFDEEWFDFDSIISGEQSIEKSKRKNSLYRCDFCLRPWSIGRSYYEAEYYDVRTFKNIPMENRTCLECESVLPADIE